MGRLDLVKSFFNADGSLKPPATVAQIKVRFTLACEYGRTDDGTPLGWAIHGWWERRGGDPAQREPYYEIVALLVAAGAPVDAVWLREDNASAEPRMFAALTSRNPDKWGEPVRHTQGSVRASPAAQRVPAAASST